MVQINLLPLRKKKKFKKQLELDVKFAPMVFILISMILAVIVVWVILWARVNAEQKTLAGLDEKLKTMKFTLQKLERLNADKERFQKKLEFLNHQLKRDILWARNLNRLSNLVPSGIWLKSLVLDSKKEEQLEKYVKLDIKGAAISIQNEEMMDSIGGFLAALKEDEIFAQQFSQIRLISSKREKAGKIEVMEFKFLCNFH